MINNRYICRMEINTNLGQNVIIKSKLNVFDHPGHYRSIKPDGQGWATRKHWEISNNMYNSYRPKKYWNAYLKQNIHSPAGVCSRRKKDNNKSSFCIYQTSQNFVKLIHVTRFFQDSHSDQRLYSALMRASSLVFTQTVISLCTATPLFLYSQTNKQDDQTDHLTHKSNALKFHSNVNLQQILFTTQTTLSYAVFTLGTDFSIL